MIGKKSGKFDIKGIEGLAKGKPVVYRIEDDKGKVLYVGETPRGEVRLHRSTVGHRRRQHRSDPFRSRLRQALRGLPNPDRIGQNQRSVPAQSRREPAGQRGTVPDRAHAMAPTDHRLRRTPPG